MNLDQVKSRTNNVSQLQEAGSPLKNRRISDEESQSKPSKGKKNDDIKKMNEASVTDHHLCSKPDFERELFEKLKPDIEALIDQKRAEGRKGSPKRGNSLVPLDDDLNIDMSRFICKL